MEYISYVELEGFKGFKRPVRIDLRNPSVLIGPNNAGKTSVIQALSLWNRAVSTWFEKKGGGKKGIARSGVSINRLDILDIPVKESRYYWNDTRVRTANNPIPFSIEVGVLVSGNVVPLRMNFTARDQESIYCSPDESVIRNDDLLKAATRLLFNLLYPMSGIAAGSSQATEEYLINEGQIRVLMGQGRTAAVLRNLCWQVFQRTPGGWEHLRDIIGALFNVKLLNPVYTESRSVLSLSYTQIGVEHPLDIALSGRGMQQVLLILSYMYSHQNSILMIDEPDAHLEILRQRQIFAILRDVAERTKCQVIIATHSEVILDEAIDTNLTFLINGEATDIAKSADIKASLKNLGVEHYYKARISPRLLIVEGSTDVAMLQAFAAKLKHPAADILGGRLFTYYTRDVVPEPNLTDELQHMAMPGGNFRAYYHALKRVVPELQALALCDSDGGNAPADVDEDGLLVGYWSRYELENYFITPELLVRYGDVIGDSEGELFATAIRSNMQKAVDDTLVEMLKLPDAGDYHDAPAAIKEKLLSREKMSLFADRVFKRYADMQGCPVPLRKGAYYTLIDLLSPRDVPDEIRRRLDGIVERLSMPKRDEHEI